MKTNWSVAALFATLSLQAAVLAQSPTPKPAAPAVTEANASTAGPSKAAQPTGQGAPAQGAAANQPQGKPGEAAPGSQSGVQGEAPKGARPPSGKPPVVVGPNGQTHASAATKSSAKVAMPGSRSEVNLTKPASRTIRVGLANTGNANPTAGQSNNAPIASIPLTSRIALASGTPTSGSETVHTWTRSGTTFSADAASSAGTAGSLGNAINAGILASSSVTNTNMAGKGAVPMGIVNDMLVRIGGMGSQMPSKTSTASAAE